MTVSTFSDRLLSQSRELAITDKGCRAALGALVLACALTGAFTMPSYAADIDQTDGVIADNRPRIFGIPIGGAKFPERYVPPLTNPLFNESPFIVSEAHFVYLYNAIPDSFPDPALGGGGGNIQAIAGAGRFKLTDRLALIATKDGYAFANFDSPLLPDESGFLNIAGGLKYAFYDNKQTGSILTGGLRVEIVAQELSTLGDVVEFQGAGAGFINPFVTGATTLHGLGLFDNVQLQGSVGANIAFDQDAETSFLHFSLHANYELFDNFYPLVEVNGFVPFAHGNRFTTTPLSGLDGVDLANFGSSDRDTTITVGGGFRYRLSDNAIMGIGAETAVTDTRNSILDWRITADLALNF